MSRREAIIGIGMLSAAVAAWLRAPRKHELMAGRGKLEDLIPETIGKWRFETQSGLVLPPSDQLRDSLYDQLLTRSYVSRDGQSVMLLIAYSGNQDGVLQVHRPEVCYPASGYKLRSISAHRIRLAPGLSLPGRYIVADSDMRVEQLIYWTRLGSRFPTRWLEQRFAVIEENLSGIVPDGVLVRISTIMPGELSGMLDEFAFDMYAAVSSTMRQVFIGRKSEL